MPKKETDKIISNSKTMQRDFIFEHMEPYSKLTNEKCNFDLTKEQFSTIREWVRKNERQDYNLPLATLNSMEAARDWCKQVLKYERREQEMDKGSYDFICKQLDKILS